MNASRESQVCRWWSMLSEPEKREAFLVLAKYLYKDCVVFIPDNHTSADLISGGMGDVDAIAPLWETTCEPILKVGR